MDYRLMAERCLDRRSDLFAKRQDAAKAGKNDVCKVLDEEMDSLATEAREYVQEAERQNEILGAVQRSGALGRSAMLEDRSGEADGEWRGLLPSMDEYRALAEGVAADGGYTVPTGTAARYVDMLRNKAVFLKGIPAANLVPYSESKFTLPVLSDSTLPQLVAENAAIAEGDDTWAGLEFDSKKYADLRTASNEILADTALNLRNVVAETMTKNAAAKFDIDAFQGDGSTTPILGIIGQGTTTAAGTTAGDVPTFDDIADAIGRIWAGDGSPSVIWASPDAAIALSKERDGGSAYVADADSAVGLARRLPMLVSSSIPVGDVIVADGSRIFAGMRQDVRVAVSTHAQFENDKVVFRLTMRCAGLYAVEATSVQVLTVHP